MEGEARIDDVAVLNLLHDGGIVAVARTGDDVLLTVEIAYLRARLTPPGGAIVVRLVGCSRVAYEPYDGAPVEGLEAIAAREPQIVQAVREGDLVRIWGGDGCLLLRYGDVTLALDDGTPLSREVLAATARAYWDDWKEHWRQ